MGGGQGSDEHMSRECGSRRFIHRKRHSDLDSRLHRILADLSFHYGIRNVRGCLESFVTQRRFVPGPAD